MSSTSLEIDNLHLWYGSFKALDGISLSLEKGHFLALLGPSGCGKTSLLRSIAGFVHPQDGKISIGDRDVIDLLPRQRNLGMVFQNYALFPHMTVAENAAFGLKCRKTSTGDIGERVRQSLDMVGLTDLADRKPNELSGGQQQRVALARALVIKPDVLLLDEPLGALDKKLRTQMQTELKALQRQLDITTVFVTHDQEEALGMADSIAIMRDGKIEQLGTPEQIFAEPTTTWVADFIGSGNVISGRLVGEEGVLTKLDAGPGIDLHIPSNTIDSANPEQLIFIRAEHLILKPTDDHSSGLKVASHRYLGTHVEIHISVAGNVIRALVDPAVAQTMPVASFVTITADPAECRVIAPQQQ